VATIAIVLGLAFLGEIIENGIGLFRYPSATAGHALPAWAR